MKKLKAWIVMNNNNWMLTCNMKIIGPCRDQMEMQLNCLDTILPADHLARSIWQFVDAMDTTPCFSYINSFIGVSGRATTSPKILFALWIFSILDGNLSARKLETLCKFHDAYKWIAGGAPINRTMLADFRSKDPIKFEDLLTNSLAAMLKSGLIEDRDFAQDGTRVKASAGLNSFRREETLNKLQDQIRSYIKELAREDISNENERRKKERAIRMHKERLQRVEDALDILQKERVRKEENGKKNNDPPSEEELKNTKASTTDPIVRKMRMGDNGFRLAYNLQFATGMNSRLIFAADVVTTLDPGTSPRLMAIVHSRLAKLGMPAPENWIGDGSYSGKDDVNMTALLFPKCKYYAPPQGVVKGVDPKKHRRGDTEAVKKWRDMIGTKEVNEVYKHRCSTAEFSNAQVKNRGLREFMVRGIEKVKGMTLLHVIANNIRVFLGIVNNNEQIVAT